MKLRVKRLRALFSALRAAITKVSTLQLAYDTTADQLDTMAGQYQKLKGDHEVLQKKYSDAMTRIDTFERESREWMNKDLNLRYMEVRCKAPILWINSPSAAVVNASTFASIKHQLAQLAPKIEMIILTYGNVRLHEFDDTDLEKIGLCRIVGHLGGEIGPKPVKQLNEGNGSSGQ